MIYDEFIYNSPIGEVYIAANNNAVLSVNFSNKAFKEVSLSENKVIKETVKQLQEYFSGERKVFNLPLNPIGTNFQKLVWKELIKIPFGETRKYKDIAEAIGKPNASRAIGNANNKNPIGIIIPCHRVIGANGKLVGYAGGLDKKELLLKFEKQKSLY